MPASAQSTAEAMDQYGPLVLRIAWRVLPDPDEVQDIYQETFLQFHASTAQGARIEHPKAWLCRTALNAALKRQQQHRRQAGDEVPEQVGDGAKEIEQALLVQKVRELTADLPDRQREVFVLRNFEGLPFAEIGILLQCTEESARANEYKALQKIRAWMDGSRRI
ncbi:MAG: sigma-70 family RNA polymerase sigma factor [Candidatus Latescibacteria bacterium]|nr:sigma-70 family RNA polymerase sigma factor [Candidatus Latescibacterota bacterium]